LGSGGLTGGGGGATTGLTGGLALQAGNKKRARTAANTPRTANNLRLGIGPLTAKGFSNFSYSILVATRLNVNYLFSSQIKLN
jgi:hypothetical protein